MFILYYNNINYTINTFKYNLYPKTFHPLELSNNDKKVGSILELMDLKF